MARFPSKEAEVLVLAQELTTGLGANAATFPSPPVPVDFPPPDPSLTLWISEYVTARDAAVAAAAAAEEATTTKDEALQTLIDAMKADLRYAENTVDFDDDKLKLLGWGGRKTPTALEVPGQARTLEAPQQGEGWIFLDWKEPIDGGKPAAYKIHRRERPEGPWGDVSMAIESEITLADQTRGTEWEYRVVAVNKAGEGVPSNTVMAVL